MFLKNLFKKKTAADHEQQGDQLFARERYADARYSYQQAEELLQQACTSDGETQIRIAGKIAAASTQLATLNIREARLALASGEENRAAEYLELAAQFSQEPEIHRQITDIINSRQSTTVKGNISAGAHGCATCTPHQEHASQNQPVGLHQLSIAEQFELLVAPLPDDLPQMYRDLGDEFASAYVAGHGGDVTSAYAAYERLNRKAPSDVLFYEMAVIKAHQGAIREAEALLRNALALNSANALCCLSLVQLFSDQSRFGEAQQLLERMRAEGILGPQVLLLLGDNFLARGNIEEAEAMYRQALAEKGLASSATERLIPLLEQSGRLQERDILVKKHCGKGCC